MFRKMRRFKQQLPQEEAIKILEEGQTGVLAVLGDDDYPYAVPINYAYKDGKIYFHGAKEGHKQDALAKNPKVSLCVIAQDTLVKDELTTYFKSVIAFGQARILTDEEEIYKAAEILGLKYNDNLEKVTNEIKREWPALRCVEITVEHLTGKEAIELTRARTK